MPCGVDVALPHRCLLELELHCTLNTSLQQNQLQARKYEDPPSEVVIAHALACPPAPHDISLAPAGTGNGRGTLPSSRICFLVLRSRCVGERVSMLLSGSPHLRDLVQMGVDMIARDKPIQECVNLFFSSPSHFLPCEQLRVFPTRSELVDFVRETVGEFADREMEGEGERLLVLELLLHASQFSQSEIFSYASSSDGTHGNHHVHLQCIG